MSFSTVNPYNGQTVKTFPIADAATINAAIESAHAAFLSWRTTPLAERAAVLQRAADLLRKDSRRFSEILTLEMGKLIGEAEAEVELSAKILEYYVKFGAKQLAPRVLQANGFADGDVQLIKEPLGVLFAIEPWNFPFYQVIRVAAPQATAGNAVLLKHASNVPQSALAMEQLFRDAGAPEGLLTNLFVSHDDVETVIADPRVRGVALTGSERAGSSVAALAGKHLKKSTLELGGADAFIVLSDADVEKAAKWAVFGRHWNAGQVCVSSKRIIVEDAIYDSFLAHYRAGVAELVAGDPLDPTTTLAPLSSQGARDGLAKQVETAISHGAKAETVGKPVPTQGSFYQPTLLTDISPDNPAYHTEFFGPVSQIYRVADEDAAIKLANDSPYGLGGSVFSRDVARAKRVGGQLETGMVYINHPTGVKADIPFGGVKNSGYGHELIDLGLTEFVNEKVVVVSDIDGAF